jgi:hypothetical protein
MSSLRIGPHTFAMPWLLVVAALGCGKVVTKQQPDAPPGGADAPRGIVDAPTSSADAPTSNADAAPTCAPSTLACNADGKTLERCDANGVLEPKETCSLSCVDATSSTTAHCAHIVAPYLASVCDTPATAASVALTGGTLDPGLDASCTMIVSQSGGPDICVVRADTIAITSSVTIPGPVGSEPDRVIAFVADHDLVLSGSLDLSAHGASRGPGGGEVVSGVPGSGTAGGGGAGSFTFGGSGGNQTAGNGSAGGPAIAPPLALLMGGPSAGSCAAKLCTAQHMFGGSGGGGLALVSCLGTVTVSGTIATGGGGGQGAHVDLHGVLMPPQGGGAGGNVVIAGAGVSVTGSVYANGGGGGGGCNGQAGELCPGGDGGDGQPMLTAAPGGAGATGGAGEVLTMAPGVGSGTSGGPGGAGGGAAGHLQVYAPPGITPTVAPAEVSPAFDPPLSVPTR